MGSDRAGDRRAVNETVFAAALTEDSNGAGGAFRLARPHGCRLLALSRHN